MADATSNVQIDKRTMGPNGARWQNFRYHAEAGIVVQNDTIEVVWDEAGEEGGLPPLDIELYTHNGSFAGGSADYVDDNGDTLTLLIKDLDEDLKIDQCETNEGFTEIVHTLAGVTNGAATVEQVRDSLNADAVFFAKAYAYVTGGGILEILPRGANAKIKVGTQAATGAADALAAALPTTELDNSTRVFTRLNQVVADWGGSYDAGVKTYTITRLNASAAEKVHAVVTFS